MRLWLVVLALVGSACAQAVRLPPAAPGSPTIAMAIERVPLDPASPTATTLGDFRYAGGIAIRPMDASVRLHGLSDLEVLSDGALIAIGDRSGRAHV